jgi:hypothetical protein
MNDQIIALIRTAWQAVLASALAYLVTLGIEIDSAAAFAVTWPIVMAIYYAVAAFVAARVSKLSLPLTGPGPAPKYKIELPDEALEDLLR